MQTITYHRCLKFILLLTFVLMFCAVKWFLFEQEQAPIQHVKIQGHYPHVSQGIIRETALPFVQAGFFTLDIAGLRQRLVQLPWIERVDVTKIWPDTVIINIHERHVIARWQAGALIDNHGQVFKPASIDNQTVLPHLSGPESEKVEVLQQYRNMNKQLHSLGLFIKTLHVSKDGAWEMHLNNGMALQLGKNEPGKRLARFVKIYPAVFGSQGTAAQRVDLRYPNGLAVQWQT